ncbi:VCBS repeat-containing protein [Streptomyces sp. UNOB3_S3]|uniref:FG-GAP repeat domain-containing protein n=1 Tax=Streptomyces sp. UNOB3_S3 TaxID=2871682 RepID=UPI001E58DB1A|nr:VCBS repeat-containing protein [Streptomyces sp. UNOB3_S3]MCC3778746.1 VCBS repeat-containing protein [Streptomyces sp. UNOB3_S3]
MASSSGRKRGRALSRLATTAIAVTLLGTTAGTAFADGTTPAAAAQRAATDVAQAPTVTRSGNGESRGDSPVFPLMASKSSGELFQYVPDGRGGFKDRKKVTDNWLAITSTVQIDQNQDGLQEHIYFRTIDGKLWYGDTKKDTPPKEIGGGWNIYDRILSPGNLGGANEPDLLARDKAGVLWLYLQKPDGSLTDRYRVGGGWDQYTDIVGRGDFNDDGKADMVARDKSGVLWFYKGTGDYKDPFASRVKIGGGWDTYNFLVSSGDVNLDGRSDLLARDKSGVLWLYKGNGNQNDPFENRVRIGGGWDQYNNFF